MSEELDRFSRMGRRALGQRNEVGLPQDALNVSSYEQFSVVDPDPNWILIQELCGYGSGSKKVNTGVGWRQNVENSDKNSTVSNYLNFLFN